MVCRRLLVLSLFFATEGAQLVAQEPSSADGLPSNTEHLATMAKRLERLTLRIAAEKTDEAPKLLQPPVMRSSNTGMNHDGAVWLWLDGAIPVAALSMWNRGPVWYCENTNLSSERLEITGWQAATWLPPGTTRRWISQDEIVPDSSAARQRTLREISRKFTAREDRLGVKSELRLLTRPIYGYADPQRSVIEGALFAFVLGTDPELFMQIEARRSGETQTWQVAFARMASADLTVNSGDKEIWNAAAVPKDGNRRFDTDYCMVREVEGKK